MKTQETYKSQELCNLVAYFINCDNAHFHFADTTFTAESVWHSNSHGELFGVYDAMQMALDYYNLMNEQTQAELKKVMAGEQGDQKQPWFIGLRCITTLYRCPDDFVKQVDDIWHKLVHHGDTN